MSNLTTKELNQENIVALATAISGGDQSFIDETIALYQWLTSMNLGAMKLRSTEPKLIDSKSNDNAFDSNISDEDQWLTHYFLIEEPSQVSYLDPLLLLDFLENWAGAGFVAQMKDKEVDDISGAINKMLIAHGKTAMSYDYIEKVRYQVDEEFDNIDDIIDMRWTVFAEYVQEHHQLEVANLIPINSMDYSIFVLMKKEDLNQWHGVTIGNLTVYNRL